MSHIAENLVNFIQPEALITKWNTITEELVKSSTAQQVPMTTAYKYKGDFYRLLSDISNIDYRFWYPTLIVNGLTSPLEYDGQTLIIYTPNIALLNKYYTMFTKNM